MRIVWLLAIAFLPAAGTATTYNVSTIVLGTALEFTDPIRSVPVICGLDLAVERVNAGPVLLPDTKIIQRMMKSNCSSKAAGPALLAAASSNSLGYAAGGDGPLIGVIGPGCSGPGT